MFDGTCSQKSINRLSIYRFSSQNQETAIKWTKISVIRSRVVLCHLKSFEVISGKIMVRITFTNVI